MELHNKVILPQHCNQLCDSKRFPPISTFLSHQYSRNLPARTIYPGAFPAETFLIQLQLKVVATEGRIMDVHLPSVLALLCVEKV